MMQEHRFTVRFDTPAFLGNAGQAGQWRAPPLKALLRQWWRVAAAKSVGYDVARLRAAEAETFGSASDDNGGSRQSRVRLRLGSWKKGTLAGGWGDDPPAFHKEVGNGGRNVGSHLYLGYGPLTFERGTKLKAGAAIQEGEHAELRLAWPAEARALQQAVQLADWFGTMGGRSRNGWGSLTLVPEGERDSSLGAISASDPLLTDVSLPLEECLQRDWPHALGTDARGRLVWRSQQGFDDWRSAMGHLAEIKIGFRTQEAFALTAGQGPFSDRHVLAYPVTHHSVAAWGNQARLANQLRFKVRKRADNKYEALAFHLPCAIPREMVESLGRQAPDTGMQAAIWRKVHAVLDERMQRL